MPGDAGAAADQLDARALVDIHVPADLRRNAAENSPDIEPPMMTARRLRPDLEGEPGMARTIPAGAGLSIVTARNDLHNRED